MKALWTLAATLAFVAGSYAVQFSGFAPEQFPVPQDDPPVQPAGYAFAIWGLIFLGLLVSAVFGLLRRKTDPAWQAVRAPLILSVGVGAAWNAVANASPLAATVLIWVMLGAALAALWKTPDVDKPWLAWPLGLYAGWLTAASCVAFGLMLAGYGVVEDPAAVALGAIVGAAALSFVVLTKTRNPAYALAVVWALVALYIKNGDVLPSVGYTALIAAVLLAGLTLWQLLRPTGR